MPEAPCPFCRIIAGEVRAEVVLKTPEVFAFLDHRPLFPGHVLVVPNAHCETLGDLPEGMVAPLFGQARRLALAVESALGAVGSFVAVNNKVSQSVPHLHVHVVPRTTGDGLKGFFWPRHAYRDDAHRADVATRVREALDAL